MTEEKKPEKKGVSRRGFIQGAVAGLVVGAAATYGATTMMPPTAPPPPTPEDVELKYDDGTAGAFLAAGGYGYIIDFLPPAMPFTIKKVKICGVLYGSGWE